MKKIGAELIQQFLSLIYLFLKLINMEKSEKKTRKRKVDESNDVIEKPAPKKRLAKRTDMDSDEPSGSAGIQPKAKKNVAKKSEPRKRAVKKDANENESDNENDCQDMKSDGYNNYLNEADMLSYFEKIPPILAQKFISLLSDGCTLPFIARYRKEAVGHLMPDR